MEAIVSKTREVDLVDNHIPYTTPGGLKKDAESKAQWLQGGWERMSDDDKMMATNAYNMMRNQMLERFDSPEKYDADIKWHLFNLGYLQSDLDGNWIKPPGWEFQDAN